MPFTENLSPFFASRGGGFAIPATITGAAGPVYGILDVEPVEVMLGEMPIIGNKPVFTCKTADLPALSRGLSVVINSTSYKLVKPENDGTGVTKLILDEV